jgi:alpha-tubulin suppressor-like RCC1 family protein
VCWGYNYSGQLGNGRSGAGEVAVSPVAVKNLADVQAVAAGGKFTCALRTNGQVACWGDNLVGELGNGSDAGSQSSVPVPVVTLSDATQIAAGDDHACALRAGGTMVCWGGNQEGELGNASTTPSTVPVPVATITGVTSIAAGLVFSCASLQTGAVYCWGSNTNGQLGNGFASTMANPTPGAVPAVNDAIAVSCGFWHACALRKNGALVCWGQNEAGQLGNGAVEPDAATPVPPVAVQRIANGATVSVRGEHSCATTSDSHIDCWGQNDDSEVGGGAAPAVPSPVAVPGF